MEAGLICCSTLDSDDEPTVWLSNQKDADVKISKRYVMNRRT